MPVVVELVLLVLVVVCVELAAPVPAPPVPDAGWLEQPAPVVTHARRIRGADDSRLGQAIARGKRGDPTSARGSSTGGMKFEHAVGTSVGRASSIIPGFCVCKRPRSGTPRP